MQCPVCAKPQFGHPPCAVCHATNAHTRLCDPCKADPLNAGWVDTCEELGVANDVASIAQQDSPLSWSELQDQRMRVTTLQTQILAFIRDVRTVRYRRRDRRGRSKGWATRKRGWSSLAIARELNCDHGYVRRIRRRYMDYVRKILFMSGEG
jgi:hypothetical protein